MDEDLMWAIKETVRTCIVKTDGCFRDSAEEGYEQIEVLINSATGEDRKKLERIEEIISDGSLAMFVKIYNVRRVLKGEETSGPVEHPAKVDH